MPCHARLRHFVCLTALIFSVGCSAPGTWIQTPTRSDRAPTRAQNLNPVGPWFHARSDPGWSFDFLVGAELEPDYPGSDDTSVEPEVFARALYNGAHGDRYFASLGSLGAWFSPREDWALGALLEYEEARESDENDALIGLDEVDATVEGQFTLARRFGDWTLAGVLQPDLLGRGKGFVSFVGLGYDRMLGDD